jgi:iron complex transport system permease protein
MNLSARRGAVRWLLLILLFAGVLLFAASWGAPIPFSDLWSSDPSRLAIARRIFLTIRPVRILAGALVGASLAVSGATLQAVFKNPLAEPYLLGISAGGALGATISKALPALQLGAFDATTLFAFAGALLASFAIYALGRSRSTASFGFDRARLLLTGVALSAFLAALMALVVALSSQADLARQITFWLLGGLSEAATPHLVALALCLILGVGVLLASSRDLNALQLGDEDAASLGVEIEKLHTRLLIVSSLMSAAAVAAAGLIGFIGLLGPHLVRLVFGNDARRLVPASALGGATLLVLCDAFARSALPPQELPVGIVTALLGVPLFLMLAQKKL